MEEVELKIDSVAKRIIKISNEIRVNKSGHNDFIKSNYFEPDTILRALNPLLLKYNLIILFNMTYSKEKEMYEGVLQIADSTNTVADGEQSKITYRFDIPIQELKNAGNAQSAGATQTYCKRYLIMNAFNLADNKVDLDNVKNKLADVVDYKKKLEATKSLEELKKVFASLPQRAKAEMYVTKEKLKAEFAK